MTQTPTNDPSDHIFPPVDATKSTRQFLSEELFEGNTELLIRHGSEVYRLRVTRTGKLILTK